MTVARAVAVGLLAAALPACAVSKDKEAPVTSDESVGACNADAARFAIGKPWTTELGEQARVAAGAATLRVIRPGQMITDDYVSDRLNIELNESGIVTQLRCG